MTSTPDATQEPATTPEQHLLRRAESFARLVADAEQRGVLLEVIALAALAGERRAANRDWGNRRRAAIRTMSDAERAQLNALRRTQRNDRTTMARPTIPVPQSERSRPTTNGSRPTTDSPLVVVGPLRPAKKKVAPRGIPPSGGVGGGVRVSARTAAVSAVVTAVKSGQEAGNPGVSEAAAEAGAEVIPISLDGGSRPTTTACEETSSSTAPPTVAAPPSRRRAKLDAVAEAVVSDPLDMAGTRAASVQVTWLTPYYDAWKAAGGGHFNGGEAARWFAKIEKEHGAAAALARWTVLLTRKPLSVANPAMLAKAWGEFAPGATAMAPVAHRAHRFWSVAVTNRWLSARDRNDVRRELERTLAKGVVTFDLDDVLAFLCRINRRELNDAGAWAPKKLAEYGDVPAISYTGEDDGQRVRGDDFAADL